MSEANEAGRETVGIPGKPNPKIPHARGWFIHFYTGLLLGLVTVVLIGFLHWLPAIAALDRYGQDLAQIVYANGSHPTPAGLAPVTLLALDFSDSPPEHSEVADITEAITLLTRLKPKAIVIDQEFADTVAPGTMEELLSSIKKAAAQNIQVVVLPILIPAADGKPVTVQQSRLNTLHHVIGVTFAAPFLFPDPDGVIRSTPDSICVIWPGEKPELLPTLGTSLHDGRREMACGETERLEILYTVGQSAFQEWAPALERISPTALHDPDGTSPGRSKVRWC